MTLHPFAVFAIVQNGVMFLRVLDVSLFVAAAVLCACGIRVFVPPRQMRMLWILLMGASVLALLVPPVFSLSAALGLNSSMAIDMGGGMDFAAMTVMRLPGVEGMAMGGIWTAGFLLLCAAVLGAHRSLRRSVELSRVRTPDEVRACFDEESYRLLNRRSVFFNFLKFLKFSKSPKSLKFPAPELVCVENSRRYPVPFVMGLCRPVVVIPRSLDGDTLRWAMRHELAHAVRCDGAVRCMGWIFLGLNWFNPLAWLAAVLLCADMELACDTYILAPCSRDERKKYAAALLDVSCAAGVSRSCFAGTGVRILHASSYASTRLSRKAAAAALFAAALLAWGYVGAEAKNYTLQATEAFASRINTQNCTAGDATELINRMHGSLLISDNKAKYAALLNDIPDSRRLDLIALLAAQADSQAAELISDIKKLESTYPKTQD